MARRKKIIKEESPVVPEIVSEPEPASISIGERLSRLEARFEKLLTALKRSQQPKDI